MRYSFDRYEIDLARLELSYDGNVVRMEPQSFALLCLLVEKRNRVLLKSEIIDEIWQGRIVTDYAISTAVKGLRAAIGDDGKTQRYIKTVWGKGFRFVGDVISHAPASTSQPGKDWPEPIEQNKGQPTIAVLPFGLRGAYAGVTAIADAIPTELIAALSRMRWLHVIARGSSFRFSSDQPDLDKILTALGASYCLSGNVLVSGSLYVVDVELSDTQQHRAIWSDRFELQAEELSEIGQSIAQSVVSNLELHLPLHEANKLKFTLTQDLDSWGSYHLGLRHMNLYNSAENSKAQEFFKQAIRLDPTFSRAHAGLSYTQFQNAFQHFGKDTDHHRYLARKHAEDALIHDPLDPFSNLMMARSNWLDGQVDGALHFTGRATDLNPNYAFGHYNCATFNSIIDEGAKAESNVALAMQLSPLDPHTQSMLGTRALAAFTRNDMDQAEQHARRAIHAPNAHLFVYAISGAIFSDLENSELANQCRQRISDLNPDFGRGNFFRAFSFRNGEVQHRVEAAFDKMNF